MPRWVRCYYYSGNVIYRVAKGRGEGTVGIWERCRAAPAMANTKDRGTKQALSEDTCMSKIRACIHTNTTDDIDITKQLKFSGLCDFGGAKAR